MNRLYSLLIALNLSVLTISQAQTTMPDTAAFSRFYQALPTVFHHNVYEYNSYSVPYKFIFSTDSANLERHFDWAGRITDEYLEMKNGERLLRFFDKNGQCFKYRKSSESECFYLHNDREPYQPLFDSAIKTTERILTEKFGKDFYKKHIRLSDISWSSKYGNGSPKMHPFDKPSQISVNAYLYLNDSNYTDIGNIYLDSLLEPTNEKYGTFFEILKSAKSDCVKTTNLSSIPNLFKKGGYYFRFFEWDPEKLSFLAYYGSEPFFRIIDKDTLWEVKTLTYDLYTKKYRTETYPNEAPISIGCGYHSPFKTEFKDTFQLDPGWRKIYLDEAIINIPEGWNLYTEKYSYSAQKTFITNGKDTLVYEPSNYRMADRISRNSASRDDMVLQELNKNFPDNLRLGRDVKYSAEIDDNGCYSIFLTTHEQGVGLSYNDITNIFTFEKICPGSIGLGLKILNTIRFHRY